MSTYVIEYARCINTAILSSGNNDVGHISEDVLNSFGEHITVRVSPIRQSVHFIVRLIPAADTALFSRRSAAVAQNSRLDFPL
jgi:hypothetical protein